MSVSVLAVLLLASTLGSAVKIEIANGDMENRDDIGLDQFCWIFEKLGPIGKILYILFTYINIWCTTAKLAAIFAILTGQT